MGHRLLVSPRRLSQRGMSRRRHTVGNRLRGLPSPGSTQRVSREVSPSIRAFPFAPYERGKVTRHFPSRFSYTFSARLVHFLGPTPLGRGPSTRPRVTPPVVSRQPTRRPP